MQSAVSRAEIRLSKVEGRLAPTLNSVSAKAEKRLSAAAGRLEPAFRMRMVRLESRLAKAGESLRLLSPFGVLDRGYSLTTDADGAIVRDASSLKKGDVLRTRFANGEAVSEVVSSNLPVANG